MLNLAPELRNRPAARPRAGLRRTIAVGVLAAFTAAPATSQGVGAPADPLTDTEREQPQAYRTWRTFTTRDGLPANRVLALRTHRAGVWVGTAGGLARYAGDRWTSWTHEHGLPAAPVSAIDIDPDSQDVWLGTLGSGLVRLSAGRITHFTQINSGLAGDLVFTVAVAGGRIWAGTNGGLSSYDPVRHEWDLYAERRADGVEMAVMNLVEHEGHLYCAAWCGGLGRIDLARNTWDPIQPPDGPGPEDDTTAAIAATRSALWWVSQAHANVLGAAGVLTARRIVLPPIGLVECAVARQPGELWLGTSHGLHVLADPANETWLSYGRDPTTGAVCVALRRPGAAAAPRRLDGSLPAPEVRCLAFDENGVWVGTDAGVAYGANRTPWSEPPQTHGSGERAVITADTPAVGALNTADNTAHTATIGVLGPFRRTMMLPSATAPPAQASHRADLEAVQAAVSRIDERGTLGIGRTCRTEYVPGGFPAYAWRLPEDDLVTLAEHAIAASIGTFRAEERMGPYAAQRLQIPMLNASECRATASEAVNPWFFRCRLNDSRVHVALLDHVLDDLGRTRIAIVRTPDAMARLHLDWWAEHAERRGYPVLADIAYGALRADPEALPTALRECRPTVVLTWADAEQSANIVRRLRSAGLAALVVASGRVVRDDFSQRSGATDEVLAPAPCEHVCHPALDARNSARSDTQTDLSAILAFETTLHVLDAIRAAGTDPHAVRRELARTKEPAFMRLRNGNWIPE